MYTYVWPLIVTEQMDEGLAGRQRQYEGWIHNLSKELNHYKAANVELSNRLRELCGPASQLKEHPKGKKKKKTAQRLSLHLCILLIITELKAGAKRSNNDDLYIFQRQTTVNVTVPTDIPGKQSLQMFMRNLFWL